jgi:hypothetical protein
MRDAAVSPLSEPIEFGQETIIQMRTFVYQVLDEHQAIDFYEKNKKSLHGDFIYVFTVANKNISWKYTTLTT